MTPTTSSPRTMRLELMSRVEGEGGITIEVDQGRVRTVTLDIFEPPRFFEAFLCGRSYREVPDLVARICGICPVAYQMTAVKALENALCVTVSPETVALRRLLYCGEWLQSHALHMYMLQTPDYLGYSNVLDLAKDYPKEVERGFQLKKIGNRMMDVIGGRSIHPVNVCVGGFHKAPKKTEIAALRSDLESALDIAVRSLHLASTFEVPAFAPEAEWVALSSADGYSIYDGQLKSSRGIAGPVDQFEQLFLECHVPQSTALHSVRADLGTSYLVGPLARLNLNRERLLPVARDAAAKTTMKWPSMNPFAGIIARAIEMIHVCEEALRIIDDYREPVPAHVTIEPRRGEGCAATEAPRGTLYHRYRVSEQGLIEFAKIVPPTSQNLQRIEDDLRIMIPPMLDRSDTEILAMCEKLVRCYDPCISCSVHLVRMK